MDIENYNSSHYQNTGSGVSIDVNKTINDVIFILEKYDYALANGGSVSFNPYDNPVVLENDDGRSFRVPQEIQTEAIRKHLQGHKHIKTKKIRKSNITYKENDEIPVLTLNDVIYIASITTLVVIILAYVVVYAVSKDTA